MKSIYKKLLNEIDSHQGIYDAAEISYNYYCKLYNNGAPKEISAISYDGMPKGTRNDMDIKSIIENMTYWDNIMFLEKSIIDKLNEKIKIIDGCINDMDIEVKVSQLRSLGLTQEQVAELVDRSTSTIKRIDKKNKNDTKNELFYMDKI